jgi:hypothetical protein
MADILSTEDTSQSVKIMLLVGLLIIIFIVIFLAMKGQFESFLAVGLDK